MTSVLTINGGSSTIRFAQYTAEPTPRKVLEGKIDRVGKPDARFSFRSVNDPSAPDPWQEGLSGQALGVRSTTESLLDWLDSRQIFASVHAVGHRIVHGMSRSLPEHVTPRLIEELRQATPYDPDHLPAEVELIEALQKRYPRLTQIACFDTAFHRDMPQVASWVAIPRRFNGAGVRRYGFHGLSYQYLVGELTRIGDPAAQNGRVILAHLGSGASLAAVLNGRSIDTSMGFTPASGLVMATRSGDLDPGLISYLARTESMNASRFNELVNHDSGLLGISETSSDMQKLLETEGGDPRASEAIELFCYQTKKWIGAYAAALGGLDTLVFSGGIGENAPSVRARICAGLNFLGVTLDEHRNLANQDVISSSSAARPKVRVIRTDEEWMIATLVYNLLGLKNQKGAHSDR